MRVLISTSSYVASSLSTGPFLIFMFGSSFIGATACSGVQNTKPLALLAWAESVGFGGTPVLYFELFIPSRPAVVPVLATCSCLIGGSHISFLTGTNRYCISSGSAGTSFPLALETMSCAPFFPLQLTMQELPISLDAFITSPKSCANA